MFVNRLISGGGAASDRSDGVLVHGMWLCPIQESVDERGRVCDVTPSSKDPAPQEQTTDIPFPLLLFRSRVWRRPPAHPRK